LEEIVENAISAEEPFVPLSERLRRYEEEVEEKSIGLSPEKRSNASPHLSKPSHKVCFMMSYLLHHSEFSTINQTNLNNSRLKAYHLFVRSARLLREIPLLLYIGHQIKRPTYYLNFLHPM
jgi:hypothetical protein